MTSKPKLKPNQRLVEYPNEGFAILDGNLYCNNCDCDVSWIHKSDVLRHTQTAKHGKCKQRASSISAAGNAGDGNGPDGAAEPREGSAISRPKAAKRQCTMNQMVSTGSKKVNL